MSRKRKAQDHNTFYFDQSEVADRDALAVVQRVKGSKIIRQTTVLAAPEPVAVPAQDVPRDFDDIQTILGDTQDINGLANSNEVTEQYIKAPRERRKAKKAPGGYATTVSLHGLSLLVSNVTQVHDQVLQDWVTYGHRETALAEMLRLEGWRGIDKAHCPTCPPERRLAPSIRCDDCWGNQVLCVECCVQEHEAHPLHRIKV